jgi:hypothetical protein
MTDLADLYSQRDALDRQIIERRRQAGGSYDDGLDALHEAAAAFAAARGLRCEETRRKNVLTMGIEGRIAIEFGYHDGEHARLFAVSTADGVKLESTGGALLSPESLTALLPTL